MERDGRETEVKAQRPETYILDVPGGNPYRQAGGAFAPLPEAKKLELLEARTRKLSYTAAAREAGVSRRALFDLRKSDPDFAEAMELAKDEAIETLESSVYERAFKDPILAMFVLKGHRPEYNDKYQAAMAFARASGTGELAQAILKAAEVIDKLTDGYSPRRRGERGEPNIIEGAARSVPGAGPTLPTQPAIGGTSG